MEEQFDIRDYKPTGKERDFENALRPVSYTHLTLPTILRV